MPQKVWGHSMVTVGYSVISMGGFGETTCNPKPCHLPVYDDIYQLDCADTICFWTTLEQKLNIKRAHFVAMEVPNDTVYCTEVGRAPLIIFNFAIYWLGLSIWILHTKYLRSNEFEIVDF